VPTKLTDRFTVRQRQVVALVAAGYSNAEIGDLLGLSARTAKAHCDVLRRKLGVPRRRQIPAAYRLLTGEDPLPPLDDLQTVLPPTPSGGWGEHFGVRIVEPLRS
jgi:DNA-binding CsgD family transcriptional regulator